MGYFPNGTSQMYYAETYCDKCIHGHEDAGAGCPVMFMHLMDNYKECNKKNSYLHRLIPRDKHGNNGKCVMFYPADGKPEPTKEAEDNRLQSWNHAVRAAKGKA